jgi:hypothetical protein
MSAVGKIGSGGTMATRWRRRRMCVLLAGIPAPAALREVSGRGAFLETNARPALGARVRLQHPDAGTIEGVVRAVAADGVQLAFDCGDASVAFALAAITADMSRPT